jgi:hypothetical protein
MKIDKQHDFIIYNDDEHVYVDTRDNQKCISVTTLIHKFVTPFDGEFWSRYKALERLTDKETF